MAKVYILSNHGQTKDYISNVQMSQGFIGFDTDVKKAIKFDQPNTAKFAAILQQKLGKSFIED